MTTSRFATLCAVLAFALLGLAKTAPAQTVPPAWSSTATYAIGDLVNAYGNIYRCTHAVSTHGLDPSKTYANWELFYVRTGTTLVIGKGQTFPSLATAWSYSENASIAPSAYLHLNISTAQGNFAESFSVPFSLDHPFGASISILGDDASNITLTFKQTNALTIDSGHAFGTISNIQLISTPPLNDVWNAVSAQNNASISKISGVVMNGFNNCVVASYGASVNMSGETLAAGNQSNEPTYGIYAIYGGIVSLEGCTVTGCLYGIEANNGGIVDAISSTISDNGVAVQAEIRGHINISEATISSSQNWDIIAKTGGTVEAQSASYDNSKAETASEGYIFTS